MAIAITIKPQHLCNILNEKKLGEVRKNKALYNAIKKMIAKEEKAIIYCICSKAPHESMELLRIYHDSNDEKGYYYTYKLRYQCSENDFDSCDYVLNGKVVCKFECDKLYDIDVVEDDRNGNYSDTYLDCELEDLEDMSCLQFDDFVEYLWNYDKWCGWGYAIPIQNLTIFEKAKELKELKVKDFERVKVLGSPYGDLDSVAYHYEKKIIYKPLTTAPQNFCYVEDTL